MIYWIWTLLITAIAFLITAYIVPGFQVNGLGSAIWAALLVGILNLFLRPILLFLSLPINILTLGLFTFVVNAIVLMLASKLLSGFEIKNWTAAIIGAIVLAICHAVLQNVLGNAV